MDSTLIAGVESEEGRATRELLKARVATRRALGEIRKTSRELRTKTGEANARIGTPAEHSPVAANPTMPHLPPASPLWA